MPRCRNVANSSSDGNLGEAALSLSLYRAHARPDPWSNSRFRIAVAYQVHEFLRG